MDRVTDQASLTAFPPPCPSTPACWERRKAGLEILLKFTLSAAPPRGESLQAAPARPGPVSRRTDELGMDETRVTLKWSFWHVFLCAETSSFPNRGSSFSPALGWRAAQGRNKPPVSHGDTEAGCEQGDRAFCLPRTFLLEHCWARTSENPSVPDKPGQLVT